MGPGDVCRVPLAAVCHGRARQTSESGPCRRVLWVPDPWSQYSGKIRFIENMGYKTRGVAMFLKIVLTPRQAYPEVKLQGRDLMRVVGIVAPFAPMGVRYPGKIRFIEPQEGGEWAQETCAGCL